MNGAYYRVNVGTEKAPEYVEFAQLPTTEDIRRAVTDADAKRKAAQAAAQQQQGKRKE